MTRWFTPLLFAAATAWMWFYNGTHDDRKIVVPFIDQLWPAIANDPAALAAASVQVAAGLTVLVTVLTFLEQIRAWRAAAAARALDE